MPAQISAERLSALIARIYDCALDPDLWPVAMDAICSELDLRTGVVSLIDIAQGQPLLACATGFEPSWLERLPEYSDGLVSLWGGEASVRNLPLEEPAVLSAVNAAAVGEASTDPFHLGFNRPQGFVDAIAVGLTRDETMIGTIGFNRHADHGLIGPREIEVMRLLVPHLQRAVAVSRVLDMQRIRQSRLEETLNALDLPLFVIDSAFLPDFTNAAAVRLLEQGDIVLRTSSGLRLTEPEAQRRVEIAIQALLSGDDSGNPFGVAVRDTRDSPWIVHILPLSAPLSGRGSSLALFFLGPERISGESALDALASLYELTGAEARVMRLLCRGYPTRSIAEELGTATSTTRTHILRVYEKTGVHRQADLIALATRLTAPLSR